MQYRFVGGLAACCVAVATAGPAAAAVIATYTGSGVLSLGFELPGAGEYLLKISGSERFSETSGIVEESRLFRDTLVDGDGNIVFDDEFGVPDWGEYFFGGLRSILIPLSLGPTAVDTFPDGSVLTQTQRGFVDILGSFGPEHPDATYVVTLATVPEPATWLTMIAGFGLLGAAVRRRRAVATAG